jgi:Glycosyl transferases group 1.
LFDFIQAGVPIIASHLTEIEKIIQQYDLGLFIESHNPEEIAKVIKDGLSDKERKITWKKNLSKAALELNWENEEKKLLSVYQRYV